MGDRPVVRVEEAGLGPDAPVRLVLSRFDGLDELQRPWAVSGATLVREGPRMRATTTREALARAVGRALGTEAAKEMTDLLTETINAWSSPTPHVLLPSGARLDATGRPLMMGIVNVTPDSFSDGGAVYPDDHPDAGVAAGRRMVDAGADILDVGGESTRPRSDAVSVDEELRRVVPVISGLAELGVPLSVDSVKPEVARAALQAGATIVNDVSGARDAGLLAAAAEHGAAYVLMHTRGTPATMPDLTDYTDVVAEVYEFLADGIERCVDAGIDRDRVLVDPGIGFAKTAAQSLALMAALRQFRGLRCPVLVGASRKSFLGTVIEGREASDRLAGSLACAVSASMSGAAVIRVHDVLQSVEAIATAAAIAAAGREGATA